MTAPREMPLLLWRAATTARLDRSRCGVRRPSRTCASRRLVGPVADRLEEDRREPEHEQRGADDAGGRQQHHDERRRPVGPEADPEAVGVAHEVQREQIGGAPVRVRAAVDLVAHQPAGPGVEHGADDDEGGQGEDRRHQRAHGHPADAHHRAVQRLDADDTEDQQAAHERRPRAGEERVRERPQAQTQAEVTGPALGGRGQGREDADRRRLAGPVVAEQAEDRAGRHREVKVAEGPLLAIALAEALGANGMGDLGVLVHFVPRTL